MAREHERPLCQVGDIVRYSWGEPDSIFFVFDMRWIPSIGKYQYSCYSFSEAEILMFEFCNGPPEVLS